MWPQFLNQLELTISCLCALTVWQASSLRTGEPGWMGGWMDGWMGGWVDGWMEVGTRTEAVIFFPNLRNSISSLLAFFAI